MRQRTGREKYAMGLLNPIFRDLAIKKGTRGACFIHSTRKRNAEARRKDHSKFICGFGGFSLVVLLGIFWNP